MVILWWREGEWSCYGGGKFMEGEWSLYRGAHFNGHVYIVLYSMVNRWCFVSCIRYILPLNLLIFLFINVFLHTAKFLHTGEREGFMPAKHSKHVKAEKGNDILTNVWEHVSLMEREWSCYGGGQFNGGRMVLQRWSV